jgi:hypothetical protein
MKMSLRDRFRHVGTGSEQSERNDTRRLDASGDGDESRVQSASTAVFDRNNDLKARIHRRMVERINLSNLESVDPEMLRGQIGQIITALLSEEHIPLTEAQRTALEQEVLNETFGLGPIEPLLHDPDVSDILVNTHRQVFVERFGLLEVTDARFDDNEHLMRIIDRIVSKVGRRIDESSPMVDARLPDGSRVNAIIPPWHWTARSYRSADSVFGPSLSMSSGSRPVLPTLRGQGKSRSATSCAMRCVCARIVSSSVRFEGTRCWICYRR